MTEQINQAIQKILTFKKFFEKINPKLPRKLVGDLGEYFVYDELKKRGKKVELKSGQSGYDILVDDKIRVEVRTSLLKNEGIFSKEINFWGWRIENRNQKKNEKFDFLVCVAFDDSWKNPKFYIFSYGEAYSVEEYPDKGWRFTNVKRGLRLFPSIEIMNQAIKLKPMLVVNKEREINLNIKNFENCWSKISK